MIGRDKAVPQVQLWLVTKLISSYLVRFWRVSETSSVLALLFPLATCPRRWLHSRHTIPKSGSSLIDGPLSVASSEESSLLAGELEIFIPKVSGPLFGNISSLPLSQVSEWVFQKHFYNVCMWFCVCSFVEPRGQCQCLSQLFPTLFIYIYPSTHLFLRVWVFVLYVSTCLVSQWLEETSRFLGYCVTDISGELQHTSTPQDREPMTNWSPTWRTNVFYCSYLL